VGETSSKNKTLLRSSIVGPESGSGMSLLNWFLRTEEPEVNGFIDHEWNGVTTLNFAKIVLGITQNQQTGIKLQHLVPNDRVNKYELLILFQEYFSKGVKINDVVSENKVDRTLETIDPLANQELWKIGGYKKIPSIRENISELAEFKGTKKILEFK
jgi:dTDP-4-dehydrorhamnose reductase